MPTEATHQVVGGSAPNGDTITEQYQTLARKVKDGSCVLFLGPNAVMAKTADGKWSSISDMCARHLATQHDIKISAQDRCTLPYVTSLIRFQNRSTDSVLQEEVAQYYKSIASKAELHPMLEQLTDLKFRIVINTTPDTFITRLYDQIAQPVYPDYYNYYKPTTNFKFDFEKDQRVVIYNLFGDYNKPESLVLSYKHQLNYIKKIVGEQQNERLPDALTNAFKDFRHHLFLGFDFEDWTLRLILDTLYKNVRENVQPFSYPSKGERATGSDTQVFFQGEFSMQFPQVDMETFVTNLVAQYQTLDTTATGAGSESPRASILVLYNEKADKDGFDALMKHLRALPARIITIADAIGKGDTLAWLRQTLDEVQVVLPLLSADFYDPATNPALPLLQEITQRNNPRKGFLVMPVILKQVALDGPLGQLATLRPSNRMPVMGGGAEDQYATEIQEGLRKYIENLPSQ
jgi:SIR2-like domain